MVTCRVKFDFKTEKQNNENNIEYEKPVGNAIVRTEKESKDIETGLIHENKLFVIKEGNFH